MGDAHILLFQMGKVNAKGQGSQRTTVEIPGIKPGLPESQSSA